MEIHRRRAAESERTGACLVLLLSVRHCRGCRKFGSEGKFSLQIRGKNARFVNAKCLIQKNYDLTISLLCCLSGF